MNTSRVVPITVIEDTVEEDDDAIIVPDKEEFAACDSCGHRSYLYVFVQPSLLAYCYHHGTEYEDRLKSVGTVVADYRETLRDEKRTQGQP